MIEFEVEDPKGKTLTLQFEHSLRSLSKWESKHRIPFMGPAPKTGRMMIDYFQCMLLSDVDPDYVVLLAPEQLEELGKYINTPQTASSIPDQGQTQQNQEVTTSELIYFWMVALKINWEAQDWHLSRLMMLVEITSFKQQPPKKRNPVQVMTDWRQENERRKKMLGTSG